MKVFRPLQLGFNHRVLEQNKKFYFIASATMGVDLSTGKTRLEYEYVKDAIECMGDAPLPDMGMPKPNGEYLVSGKYFSPGGQAVTGGEVAVRIGSREKRLYVFGPREWRGGTIAGHLPITSMPIDHAHAFGGKGYDKNPDGRGYKDGLLPSVEDPNRLVTSKADTPDPAGFGPLDPGRPQRMRFQGTYGDDYKRKFYPGFPEDFSWKYFLSAPEDQWIEEFWNGGESYLISNMHPEMASISGTLPGLYARCFIRSEVEGAQPEFSELQMNLDTIWFFPEKLLALLIWRKGIEVADDEAEHITHVLAAYEDVTQEPRTIEHYRDAMDLRLNSDDDLLHNLKTADLIPDGHRTAMQLLMDMAVEAGEESELEKNIDAKVESVNNIVDEKLEEALKQTEDVQANQELPEDFAENIPKEAGKHLTEDGRVDVRKIMKEQEEIKPDPDVDALNKKLEAIIPGITGGDLSKLDLREFSFDDIDKIMDEVDAFSDRKQAEALDTMKAEIAKAKEQVSAALSDNKEAIDKAPEEQVSQLKEYLKELEELDLEKTEPSPLVRVDVEEIMAQMGPMTPALGQAIEHLSAAKQAGIDDEITKELEKHFVETRDSQLAEIEEMLKDARSSFKETYIMVAHHMDEGLSPHKDPVEDVAARLLQDIADAKDVSGGDWACLDLSGKNLDGVDLSGAFLEQVNFKNASLKGANLKGAILARADLTGANLAGADMEEANLGAVTARAADFTDANLKSAVLSFGKFNEAKFVRCNLEDIESLGLTLSGADFREAHMPDMQFIESSIDGVKFLKTDLSTVVFYDCGIRNCDFSQAILKGASFADCRIENVRFEEAEMSGACFASTDPEKSSVSKVSFKGAVLKQANFQGMQMKGTDFSGADLENSNFLEADLTEANLALANAKGALFRKAQLANARLNSINLMEGSLAKAYLVGASFINANLFSVDFLRSTITDTDFSGANLDNTIIEDWRPR